MANVPADLKYTKEHEWAKREGDRIRVGITHFAQEQLGDVVFVELPKAGHKVTSHKTFGVVESVKAVSDLYAPISGEVVEVNGALTKTPELVNRDPYGQGWMLIVKPASGGDWDQLLTAQQYEQFLAEGAH
ncbi:MAG: glycine cleavage system protein GcvH [Candidatus Rokuibacteriota bacterium]|nr:MAG: glycine cleavage system protein GcvH [Candidatus Rokubacteria bacterium]